MLYVASDSEFTHEQGDLSSFVESAAYILGAAMYCSDIDRPRTLIAADRITEIVAASGADTSGAQACELAFREGLAAGAKAVGSSKLVQKEVGEALAALERLIGR
jgi:hypothetical protein